MEICVLGSGSAGNCTVVRLGGGATSGGRAFLIDAGFGPRTVAQRLSPMGLTLADIDAILVTHLDSDHFRPTWFNALRKHGITLHCHEKHLYHLYQHPATSGDGIDARQLHRAGLLNVFGGSGGGGFILSTRDGQAASVRPIALAHDRTGTVGYRIDSPHARLCYATDLGRVPPHLIDAMIDVDLLALESNYDPPMQVASPRPAMLKRRIMGGAGHLSNQQALEAICHAFGRSRKPPRHVVLLHLSRQCNCPKLVRELFSVQPHIGSRLCLSAQDAATPWLNAADAHVPLPGEQLTMFG